METLVSIVEFLMIVFWLIILAGASYVLYMTVRDDVRKERERKQ